MNVPKHAVLLYSGGLDSTTCLYLLHELGWEVKPLFVDYGQRHMARERAAALEIQPAMQEIALRIPWAPNALTGGATLENAGLSPGTTVVPGRNLILLSLANALAEARGCDAVAIGCNRDDAEIYIDCRSGFLSLVGQAIGRKVLVPVVGKTKAEVAAEAKRLGVPIEGRCGTARRIRWAHAIGADSIDSSLPLWSEGQLSRAVDAVDTADRQLYLW